MTQQWTWPNGAKAAVSLTYDDGNENNLDQAIPDLEEAGFRGSFYLTTSRNDMKARKRDWKDAFERGHEIGNHTTRHCCRADAYTSRGQPRPAWLTLALEELTPEMIRDDIDQAAEWLDTHIGKDPDRSFAHPCGSTAIGVVPDEASYDRAITKHHYAARTTARVVNDPQTVNLLRIGGFGCSGGDVDKLFAPCARALETGGWTALYMHGVGGPSQETTREAHRAIISRLKNDAYWVAPVKTIARYIRDHRQRRA